MSISLWLVPSARDIQLLQQLMAIRPSSDKLLSPSSYLPFIPHVTLASIPMDAIVDPDALQEGMRVFPRRSQPLRVHFRALVTGNHYFRSVFLALHPSTDLVVLHEYTCATLRDAAQSNNSGVHPKAPLFPHMSLCYIADEDAKEGERMRMIDSLRSTRKIHETEGAVILYCGETNEEILDGFDGEEIWVVKCQGPPNEWEAVQKISLQAS